LRYKNPPEGARNLQGYSMGTIEHIPPHGCTRFHRIWNLGKRGGMECSLSHRQRAGEKEIEGEKCCSPSEGEDKPRHTIAGESPVGGEVAGGGEGDARETERSRGSVSAPGSGEERFLKTEYGRTGQSTVPVRCTPDSAQ
jgi:hypothetical protein